MTYGLLLEDIPRSAFYAFRWLKQNRERVPIPVGLEGAINQYTDWRFDMLPLHAKEIAVRIANAYSPASKHNWSLNKLPPQGTLFNAIKNATIRGLGAEDIQEFIGAFADQNEISREEKQEYENAMSQHMKSHVYTDRKKQRLSGFRDQDVLVSNIAGFTVRLIKTKSGTVFSPTVTYRSISMSTECATLEEVVKFILLTIRELRPKILSIAHSAITNHIGSLTLSQTTELLSGERRLPYDTASLISKEIDESLKSVTQT